MRKNIELAADVGGDFFASINAVHGERAERVARTMSGLLLMQRSIVEATVKDLFNEGETRREIEVVINTMVNAMSRNISAAAHLMTEDMDTEERDAFINILINSVNAMSSALEGDCK